MRGFVEDHAADIAFVGLSNAERPNAGGFFGQTLRHLRRSGPTFLPYLVVNFGLPDVGRALYPALARVARTPLPAGATPLRALCGQRGIPVLKVDDVNGDAVASAFSDYRADLIITFHFDQILTAKTLALASRGGLNVHPGLLPRHRGPVPTLYALAEPEPDFGVTVHKLVAKIDAGSILSQDAVRLPTGITASAASVLLHERGRVLLDDVLSTVASRGMPEGRHVPVLPYCPFPDRVLLRRLRELGRRLVDASDLRDAALLSGVPLTSRNDPD